MVRASTLNPTVELEATATFAFMLAEAGRAGGFAERAALEAMADDLKLECQELANVEDIDEKPCGATTCYGCPHHGNCPL